MTAFTIFTDNAHGWLRVAKCDLAAIDLKPSDFSRYSYRDDKYFYLEEDRDASIFIAQYVKLLGEMPVIHDSHTNGMSAIRRLMRMDGTYASTRYA